MMKKILTLALLLLSLVLFGCGQDSANYVGYWQGETNMIFEVLTENGSDYIIRNMNGDLKHPPIPLGLGLPRMGRTATW